MKCSKIVLVGLALAGLAGCRTTQEVLDDYERNLLTGNYSGSAPEVRKLSDGDDNSRLLWSLLAGSACYLSCDAAEATALFDTAEDAMQRNDSSSVFEQSVDASLAMMVNDKLFPYDGGGQDRVFTCLYKAVNYMCTGRPDAARTELNRAAQHQENWLWERRKDVEASSRRMEKEAAEFAQRQEAQPAQPADRPQQTDAVFADAAFAAQLKANCGYDPTTSGNLQTLSAADYMNAYAHHVCGVFRWLNGDGGLAFLKESATLAPGSAAARDFAEADKGGRPSNQVWIWIEDGLCPRREEWRVDLPLFLFPGVQNYVLYAGMALPVLKERGAAAAQWQVQANGVSVPAAPLADVDKLVRTEYDVFMRGALFREVTRTLAQVGAQIALGVAADHSNDSLHQASLRLAQTGVAATAAATKGADLRSWTALPKSVKVARIDRPADGRVTLAADGVSIPISVPAGNVMVFVRKPGPQAAPVVKIAAFP